MIWSIALAAAIGQAAPCPPEHAAMGHCTPSPEQADTPASRPAEQKLTPAEIVDPNCPPEHAKMGHCTPAAPPKGVSAPPEAWSSGSPASSTGQLATDPACPPEHAAMGHCIPSIGAAKTGAAPATQQQSAPAEVVDPNCPPEHAKMGHCTPAMPAGGGAALPPVAPPSQAALSGPENAADTVFDPALMARVRQTALISEHGGITSSRILVDQLELRSRQGRDGYAWEGDAWVGGDYDKLWLKSEGEGEIGGQLEGAEVQALWSRAILPFFDFQAGVRHDFGPAPDRTHLAVGILGLAPYWFEIDAAAFLSTTGELTGRFEAEYDQRITNRLFIQPRVEFDLAAQNTPELGVGSGLSSAELELRLRYQFVPEFAPYIGVGYERRFGDTARFARDRGDDVGGWSVLFGLRAWF